MIDGSTVVIFQLCTFLHKYLYFLLLTPKKKNFFILVCVQFQSIIVQNTNPDKLRVNSELTNQEQVATLIDSAAGRFCR